MKPWEEMSISEQLVEAEASMKRDIAKNAYARGFQRAIDALKTSAAHGDLVWRFGDGAPIDVAEWLESHREILENTPPTTTNANDKEQEI